ncbi:AcrR family transcriptional regulator [Agromyces cerinus]|uniref:AcrR family transcriptional regulator n=1 Tax=Agromyces hippuratus TaxID=286438 RepID=A0A852X1U3_9MICO|nr:MULTISPECIES: TetR/AcrR family transcriptional regulator [Agromyces]MBM7831625.1 AcrR family transcriptional regulator [Agromyces cerinus]NYG22530.1 AcrR family transcriptional regulator [Agromyces hippuratus]
MAPRQEVEEIRQNLTRRDLSSAAITLIERDGLGALTMRRLAAELDCAPMSLYTHVRNRDDLIDAIVDELIERLDLREPRGEGWQQIVFQTLSAYRDLAVQLPNSFELLALAPYDTSPVAPHLARFVAGLEAAGLTTEQAQQILGIADAYASGFLVVWARSRARSDADEQSSVTDGITGLRDLGMFDQGLDALLAGLDATLVRGITPGE